MHCCACVCTCGCKCVYVCECACVCACVCMCVLECVCMCVCVCVRLCALLCLCLYVRLHMCVFEIHLRLCRCACVCIQESCLPRVFRQGRLLTKVAMNSETLSDPDFTKWLQRAFIFQALPPQAAQQCDHTRTHAYTRTTHTHTHKQRLSVRLPFNGCLTKHS